MMHPTYCLAPNAANEGLKQTELQSGAEVRPLWAWAYKLVLGLGLWFWPVARHPSGKTSRRGRQDHYSHPTCCRAQVCAMAVQEQGGGRFLAHFHTSGPLGR